MKITVLSPCLQEIRFIRGWLENCRLFADRVVISEGGSTDGTREIISEYDQRYPGWISVLEHPQEPGSIFGGNESLLRRKLYAAVEPGDGYIVNLDADEMLPDNFRELAEAQFDTEHSFGAPWYNFWRTPHYIRIGTTDDPFWTSQPIRVMFFPAGSANVGSGENHCPHVCSLPPKAVEGAIIFHYHYLFAHAKPGYENRSHEIYGPCLGPNIVMKPVFVKHPIALKYLSETINFGEFSDTCHRLYPKEISWAESWVKYPYNTRTK